MKTFVITEPELHLWQGSIKKADLFFTILILGALSLMACQQKEIKQTTNEKRITDFQRIDDYQKSKNITEVTRLLDSLKPLIGPKDIDDLTSYFIFRSQVVFPDKNLMNIYADSLVSLFTDDKVINKHRKNYVRALMMKSDAMLHLKQYHQTLEYYFKIRTLLDKDSDPENYSDFLSRIGQIYYLQGKFSIAAKFQLEAYEAIQEAKNISPSSLFFITQGALNNAGYSYEKAENLDSALKYYEKNLNFILEEEKKQILNRDQILAAKIVTLDNIGGLFEKKGNFKLAIDYLQQCISINLQAEDVSKIPAYIKLSKAYCNVGQHIKADSALNIAASLMKLQPNFVLENSLKLYRAKSDLAYYLGHYKEAFENLKFYNKAADSINKQNRELSRINVDETFLRLEDRQSLQDLEKINQTKTTYLTGAVLFGLMLLIIIFLVVKNAKQAKFAEKETLAHNKELEKTMLHLESRNNDYAKLMKIMAHDLKNPISGMVGIATLMLKEERFSLSDKEMLQLIESSGSNAIEMINQLLNSGLAIDKEVIKREDIDLQQLLRQCTDLLQYKANEKKQKIIFISEEPIVVPVGREKIWRVFNNLIVNAIKFSASNTEIVVELLNCEPNWICVKITDQGIGVPAKDREKIFEMFTSARRLGTAGEHPFGLGLAISKQIIESHQGQIWLADNPSGGTIFYVKLPLQPN